MKLAEALQSGKTAVSIEFAPRASADAEAIKRQLSSLPKVDAVIVADNHGEIGPSSLACCSLAVAAGCEPVLTMITRDRNRIALQSDVMGAALLGITNVLCLSGTHQSLGTAPEAAGAYDIDSIQLIQALAAMRDDGKLIGGGTLESKPSLFIGAGANPFMRPLELNMLTTRKKVEAGAQFLMTTTIRDIEAFKEWMAAVRAVGLDKKAAIVACVDGSSADVASQAAAIEGVRGIHVMVEGDVAAAAKAVETVRK